MKQRAGCMDRGLEVAPDVVEQVGLDAHKPCQRWLTR